MKLKKNYMYLLGQLVSRDFKVKYKRSVLGVLWSLLNPLLMTLVQYIVFSSLFRYDLPNYVVYLLCGIIIFNYFTESLSQAIFSIVSNGTLLTKVYVPAEIFPVAKVLSCGINYLLSMIPLFIIAFISGCYFHMPWFLIIFNSVFLCIFIIGMAYFLSGLMVFFRDVQFLWGILSMAWMYSTPIFYPAEILPPFMQAFENFNPIYQFIRFFRVIVMDGQVPSAELFMNIMLHAGIVYILGYLFFRKVKDKFILYL